jgi:enamine deaminase RidA (YjgF/YER057c/UK114 family)
VEHRWRSILFALRMADKAWASPHLRACPYPWPVTHPHCSTAIGYFLLAILQRTGSEIFTLPQVLVRATQWPRKLKSIPFFWYGSSIEKQTNYVLEKLAAMAEAADTSLDRAVKAEVYIGHPSDFAGMDRVWKRWFPGEPPARVVIPYMGLAGKGCRVEIALTLLAKDAKTQRKTIETSRAPKPLGHEPQAIRAGNFLFLSQQIACDSSGKLAQGMARDDAFPWYGTPGRAQMRYMLSNVSAIC